MEFSQIVGTSKSEAIHAWAIEKTLESYAGYAPTSKQILDRAKKLENRVKQDGPSGTKEEPTAPGFYKYSGGNQNMIFLRRFGSGWFVMFDNGDFNPCAWGYIEQALGVWDLVKI